MGAGQTYARPQPVVTTTASPRPTLLLCGGRGFTRTPGPARGAPPAELRVRRPCAMHPQSGAISRAHAAPRLRATTASTATATPAEERRIRPHPHNACPCLPTRRETQHASQSNLQSPTQLLPVMTASRLHTSLRGPLTTTPYRAAACEMPLPPLVPAMNVKFSISLVPLSTPRRPSSKNLAVKHGNLHCSKSGLLPTWQA